MKINDLIYMVSQMDDLQKEELITRLDLDVSPRTVLFKLEDSGSYIQLSKNKNFPELGNLYDASTTWIMDVNIPDGYAASKIELTYFDANLTRLTPLTLSTDYEVINRSGIASFGVEITNLTFGTYYLMIQVIKI